MSKPMFNLITTYLRRSIPWSLPTFGILIGGPWFMIWMIRFQSGLPDVHASDGHELLNSDPQMTLYLNFVSIMFLASGMIAWGLLPDLIMKAKLALFPVSNRTLGTFLAVVPACLLMVFNLITQSVYAVLFQNQWPIFTTTVCFGVLGMLVMAAAWWLRDFYFFKVPLVIGALVAFGYWFAQHFYPDGFRGRVVSWDVFSVSDVAVLLLIGVGSWWLTVHAFAKYRSGEANFPGFLEYLSGNTHAFVPESAQTSASLPQSDSMFECLAAMEWTKGKPISLGTACATSVLMFLSMLPVLNGHRDPLNGMMAMLIINSVVCGMLLGMWMGVELWTKPVGHMKQFYSTLPFTDAELSAAFLKICLRGVLLSMPILLGAVILAFVVFGVFVKPIDFSAFLNYSSFQTRFGNGGLMVAGLLFLAMPLAVWTACGLCLSVTATGRQWMQVAAISAPIGLFVLALVLPIFFGQWGGKASLVIGLIGMPGLALMGTIVLFVIALRQKLVSANAAILCGVLAAILMLTIGVLAPTDIYRTLIFACVGCLVVTPVAALPIAVASNRHR